MANHASTRTTQLYDPRQDTVTLGEIERIKSVIITTCYTVAFNGHQNMNSQTTTHPPPTSSEAAALATVG